MVGKSLHYCFRHVPTQCCWRRGWPWRNGRVGWRRALFRQRGNNSTIDSQLQHAFWHFCRCLSDLNSYPSFLSARPEESECQHMSLYITKGSSDPGNLVYGGAEPAL